jgi:hypothetical protein
MSWRVVRALAVPASNLQAGTSEGARTPQHEQRAWQGFRPAQNNPLPVEPEAMLS